MARFPYTSGKVPGRPAPFVNAMVWQDPAGERFRVEALLDTGADQCYVPSRIANNGKWHPEKRIRVVTPVSSSVRLAYSGHLAFFIDGWQAMPVEPEEWLIEHDKEYAIIGRSILNRFVIRLDGPALQFEID